MLRNVAVCFVALFSSFLFKDFRRKFDVPQAIGLLTLVGGSVLISYASTALQSDSPTARNQLLGIAIILAGTVAGGVFFVAE